MIQFNKEKCTGCGVCVKACPQGVIVMKERKAVLKNYYKCMECGACSNNCAFEAIDLTRGTGCLMAILKEDILKITPKGTGCTPGSGCC